MAVRGEKDAHYALRDIQPRHWQRLAQLCGPAVWERMQALVAAVDDALAAAEKALPRGFPGRVWETIAKGMRQQARRFEAEAAGRRAGTP